MSVAFNLDKEDPNISNEYLKKTIGLIYKPYPMFLIKDKKLHFPMFFGRKVLKKDLEDYLKLDNIEFLKQLKEEQIEVVNESLDILNKNGGLILNLCCGFGQTVISSYIMCKLKIKTVVIFPLKCLNNSWVETFKNFTNCKILCTDKKYTEKQFEEADVILSMPSHIKNFPNKNIDLLIVDEAHMLCTENYKNMILQIIVKRVVLCTATLERPDESHKLLLCMVGNDNIITRTSSKPFTVYIYKTNWTTEIKKKQTYIDGRRKMTIDYNALMDDIEKSETRNQFILETILQYINKHKILILTKRSNHVEYFYEKLKEHTNSIDTYYGNKQKYNDSSILIGTYNKISTGFDEINATKRIDLVIFAMPMLNIQQSHGRGLRSDFPYYIEFLDNISLLKTHMNKRKNFYKSINGDIIMK